MSGFRQKITLLACTLLTLPGLAGAQTSPSPAQGPAQGASAAPAPLYTARNFYFVFKLATTLPLTVQDTPECAASGLAGPERLLNYSFVSSRSREELARDLEGFLREHTFQSAEPLAVEDGAGRGVESARTFTDPQAPGFFYTVALHERPAGGSALCATVQTPPLMRTGFPRSGPAPFQEVS